MTYGWHNGAFQRTTNVCQNNARVLDWARLKHLDKTERWTAGNLTAPHRILAEWCDLRVVYGPFDRTATASARIILLGLTPGMTQLERANSVAKRIEEEKITDAGAIAALRRSEIPFAGSMRTNAIRMFDELGLNTALHIHSCASLFDNKRQLAHTASALHYPVFRVRDGEFINFSGGADFGGVALFRDMLGGLLLPQLQEMPRALIIPFGKSVESGLDYLIRKGGVDASRVLRGFPHPSGANGHRARLFELHRVAMATRIQAWFQESPARL